MNLAKLALMFAVAGALVGVVMHLRAKGERAGPGVRPLQVGTNEEITRSIRKQMRGTTSRCEEGPPSAEEQESWKRTARPGKLAALGITELVGRGDEELVSEMYGRLLDRRYAVGFSGMSRPEQNVYLVLSLRGEVMNGGYHQFFANPSGNCARRTLPALTETGLGALATIHQQALTKFPKGDPAEDRAQRGSQMEALPDEFAAWSEADDLYYKEPSDDPALARYIRAHADAFARPR